VEKSERSLCPGAERGDNGKAGIIEAQSELHHGISLNQDSAGTPLTRKLGEPFLMPPGAFSMHVRRDGKNHPPPLGFWTSAFVCP
jgi:hypothetical protein